MWSQTEQRTIQQEALHRHRQGWALVLIRHGEKRPDRNDWPNFRYADEDAVRSDFSEADPERNIAPPNLGVLTGQPSGGLVVADLDAIEPAIAALALPPTDLRDGRPGRPDSHWFYRITGKDVFQKLTYQSPLRECRVLEVLGEKQQAILPPSLHPSGEVRSWVRDSEPATIDAGDLIAAAGRAAVFQELAALWPRLDGQRHEAALPLVGGLLRSDVDGETIADLLALIWPTAESGEIANTIRSTARKRDAGEPYTGWRAFREMVGDAYTASVEHILEWLGVGYLDERPTVMISRGNLHQATLRVWEELHRANQPAFLFLQAASPVRVEHDGEGRLIIRSIDQNRMRYHLQEKLRFLEPTSKGAMRPVDAPIDLVRNVLATPELQLPPLNLVTSVPILSPAGDLQIEPGYHRASASYYAPGPGLTIPIVSLTPSPAEVKRARTLLLDDLLGDFPFEGNAERANALALLLLPFGRTVIDGPTPIHFLEAPTQGTGKSLLADLVVQLFCGPAGVASVAPTSDDEEWRKRLTSAFGDGAPFLYVDNVTGTLDSSSLASAVTKSQWRDRLLGRNEEVTYDVRVVWIVTANNASVSLDLARRSVRIRLNAKVERPFERPPSEFRHPNIRRWAVEHWGELVWAGLTLWQAWVAAGKPRGTAVLGSFEEWAATMSGVLDTVGVPGFLANQREFMGMAAQDTNRWHDLVEAWWEHYGNDPVRTADLYHAIAESIEGFSYPSTKDAGRTTAFGMELRQQRDTIHGDLQIEFRTDRKGKKVYQLRHLGGEKRTSADYVRPGGLGVMAMPMPGRRVEKEGA